MAWQPQDLAKVSRKRKRHGSGSVTEAEVTRNFWHLRQIHQKQHCLCLFTSFINRYRIHRMRIGNRLSAS
eukprot:scaffold138585_cov17-Cyclotella_meneghiniana.AAC.1